MADKLWNEEAVNAMIAEKMGDRIGLGADNILPDGKNAEGEEVYQVIECGFCHAAKLVIEEELDTNTGLSFELDTAIDLMVRVARGEQTVEEMGKWVSLNFPKFRNRLPEALREVPPKR